jgi:hypothetical protein
MFSRVTLEQDQALSITARARLSLAPARLAPRRGGGGALGVGRRFAPW